MNVAVDFVQMSENGEQTSFSSACYLNTDNVDKCEIVQSFPEHVRKEVVEILKTGIVKQECLTKEDILFYLEVSSMSPTLKTACEDKLRETIDMNNCFHALEIADKYGLLLLKKETVAFLVENFQNLWMLECFQSLSETTIETMCQIELIAHHSDIYLALEKWFEDKHESRLKVYCKLLEIVQKQRGPKKDSTESKNYSVYHAVIMISTTKSKNSLVTVVFNCDGEVVCHRNLFKSNEIYEDLAVACVQKDETEAPYVYMASGKHVFRYDPIVNKQENCAHLIYFRTNGSLVSLGDFIYAVGGHNNGNNVTEIEELDTKHQRKLPLIGSSWKVVATIPENITLISAPCVTHNNQIYIIGQSSNDDQVSTAVIGFNPSEKSIAVIAEYPKTCFECKATIHGSNIYIASSEGYFFKFDIKTNIFASCSDLPNKGRHFGIYTEGDLIYLIGGTSFEDNVGRFEKEEFDTQTNTWRRVKDLPCNLPICGNCDIKVPSYTSVIPFYDHRFKEL